jgi:NADP-dependent 3-hydroxy acid dehydrogenase YdfG
MAKPLVAITGASSGIGAAAAQVFSEAGYPLLLTARRVERMKELGLPSAMCRAHDVANAGSYQRLVEEAESKYGPVDLLINNAGYMVLDQIAKQTPEDWRRQFEVNCIGMLNTTAAVFPKMLERRGGTIMNVGSTAGRNIYPNHTVYCATKHAVVALTEGLRREAAPAGVRVILISPGFVLTDLLTGTRSESIKQAYRAYRDEIGGALSPTDIAKAMLFAYEQPQHLCVWEIVVTPTRQLV